MKGYINYLVNRSFKKTPWNKIVFYPYASFGKGYIVESQSLETSIRRFLTLYQYFLFLVFIISMATIGILGIFVMIPAFLIYNLKIYIWKKHLKPTGLKYNVAEAIE